MEHKYKYLLLIWNDIEKSFEVLCNTEFKPKQIDFYLGKDQSFTKPYDDALEAWTKSCKKFPIHESQMEGFNKFGGGLWYNKTYLGSIYKQGILLQPEMVEIKEEKIYKHDDSGEFVYTRKAFITNQINEEINKSCVSTETCKKTYSRDEVIALMEKLLKATGGEIKTTMHIKEGYVEFDGGDIENWIKCNL